MSEPEILSAWQFSQLEKDREMRQRQALNPTSEYYTNPPPPTTAIAAPTTTIAGPPKYFRPEAMADITSVSRSYQQHRQPPVINNNYYPGYTLVPPSLEERKIEADLHADAKPILTKSDLKAIIGTMVIASILLVAQRPCYVTEKDQDTKIDRLSYRRVGKVALLVGATATGVTALIRYFSK